MSDERTPQVPELVTPAHGNGKLKTGGTPGNRGGGRTPSAVRRDALRELDDALPFLRAIIRSDKSKDADKIAATREYARIALGTGMSMIEVRDKLDATLGVIEQLPLNRDQVADILLEVRRIWASR